ncbi:MAG: hypothetical protein AAGG51_26390 [Cyanobacteria bacterium P01_G01_bin.54]
MLPAIQYLRRRFWTLYPNLYKTTLLINDVLMKRSPTPQNKPHTLFFVNIKPIWIQSWGYFLILSFGSGAINGLLVKLGRIQSHQVSSLYQNEFTLPLCWFLLGLGLGLFLVPRMIYRCQIKQKAMD